jgi:hypothetical protein
MTTSTAVRPQLRRTDIQGLLYLAALVAIALAGAGVLFLSTPYGPGLGNDSAAYIGGARNLLEGSGYSRLSGGGEIKPITHFPPMYSLFLAAGSIGGADVQSTARFSLLALYGLNALLVGLTVLHATRSRLLSLLGAYLFAANGIFLMIHSVIMSEPLYLSFSLAGFLIFSRYLSGRSLRWLAAAGLLFGAATLTRYSGLALIATGAVLLPLAGPRWRGLLRPFGLYLLTSFLPFAAWLARNQLVSGSAANRSLSWHPPSVLKIQSGIEAFWDWLLPGRIETIVNQYARFTNIILALGGLALLVLVAWMYWKLLRRQESAPSRDQGLLVSHGVYIFIYLAAILATMTWFDASTPFENRIVAPMWVSLIILLMGLLAWLWSQRGWYWRAAVIVGVVLLAGRFTSFGMYTYKDLRVDGQGFNSAPWRNSETVAWIRTLPEDTLIYSNDPTGIYLHTRRGAYVLPTPLDPVKLERRPGYESDIAAMQAQASQGRALLIIFAPFLLTDPADQQWIQELTGGLPLSHQFPDSDVYGGQP